MGSIDIASRFRQRRLELKLSLQDVADIVDISKSTLQRYESGAIHNIPTGKLVPIAKALKTTPDWLIGWTDDISKESLIDVNFEGLLDDLGYDLDVYSKGRKINLTKRHVGGGPITEEEYHQLRDNIFAYIQFHADKLALLAEKRDEVRMAEDDKRLEYFLSLMKKEQTETE